MEKQRDVYVLGGGSHGKGSDKHPSGSREESGRDP